MNIVLKNFSSILMLVVSAVISFQVGVTYERFKMYNRQESLILANVLGEQIVTVNQIIESFGSKPKEEIILDYNDSALNTIGCSVWLDALSGFEDKDKELFFSGIDMALEKVELPNDDQCINNLLDMRR